MRLPTFEVRLMEHTLIHLRSCIVPIYRHSGSRMMHLCILMARPFATTYTQSNSTLSTDQAQPRLPGCRQPFVTALLKRGRAEALKDPPLQTRQQAPYGMSMSW